jgi:hypothetical protein
MELVYDLLAQIWLAAEQSHAYISVSRAQFDVNKHTNDTKTLGQELNRNVTKATALHDVQGSRDLDAGQRIAPRSANLEISQALSSSQNHLY